MMDIRNDFEWPFGLDEYQSMFDLTQQELRSKIIDLPASMSSFNAEMHQLNCFVVSADHTYDMDLKQQQQRVSSQLELLNEHIRTSSHKLADASQPLSGFIDRARACASLFLNDYEQGVQAGRYLPVALPNLPFSSRHFDLALCSHWLFSTIADSFYQIKIIKEFLRIAGELRIYPILNSDSEQSDTIGPVMMALQHDNFGVELREVDFQVKKESNAMLRVWARECHV